MNPFSVLTSKIFAGVSIALLLFAGVQTVRLSSAKSSLEKKRDQLAASQAALSVSNNSIDTLTAELIAKNAESDARARALQEARNKAATDAKRLDGLSRSTSAQIDALRARIGTNTADCPTPDL
jgi:Tfp pilus assembly protein PilN